MLQLFDQMEKFVLPIRTEQFESQICLSNWLGWSDGPFKRSIPLMAQAPMLRLPLILNLNLILHIMTQRLSSQDCHTIRTKLGAGYRR